MQSEVIYESSSTVLISTFKNVSISRASNVQQLKEPTVVPEYNLEQLYDRRVCSCGVCFIIVTAADISSGRRSE